MNSKKSNQSVQKSISPEVFEKLRTIVLEHGMLEVLNTLPSFFEAAHEVHNLSTLEDLLKARDSYWKGYQQYHESREQKENNILTAEDTKAGYKPHIKYTSAELKLARIQTLVTEFHERSLEWKGYSAGEVDVFLDSLLKEFGE